MFYGCFTKRSLSDPYIIVGCAAPASRGARLRSGSLSVRRSFHEVQPTNVTVRSRHMAVDLTIPLRRVRRGRPCPVCAHTDWCEVRDDGAVHCMRVPSDTPARRQGGWWHHLPV